MNWQGALTALAIGVLMGIVRERRFQSDGSKAGLRTHALVSLLGYVAWSLGNWPFFGVILAVAALVYSGYRVTATKDPGLTGEIAVLVTLMLSALVHRDAAMAVGLGVLGATLLEFKQISHRFTRVWISQQELHDALVLAVAALVVMPLLPEQPLDPWNALRPATLWRIVVLVMTVGMLGHLAQRLLGERWGLQVAGFFSGLVSSTAAIAHLGPKARQDATLTNSASAAALLSNLASMLLMFGVIGAVAPGLLQAVAWPMVAACLALLTVALLFLGKGSSAAASSIKLSESAFKLSHALMLALLMGGVSLLSAGLQALFGGTGVMVTAVVVAIVEVHAAAASVAQMSLSSALPSSLASWSLVAVLASSAAAKTLLAGFTGGLAFGWRVGLGLWLMVLSATVTLMLPMAALAMEVTPR